jgi:protein-S-isoprenylcysteine O-methyltransferase Ste14
MAMRKPIAAVGCSVFLLVGLGVFVGLVPWWLTRWRVREPVRHWAPMRWLGALLLLAGLIVLVRAFVRFVVEGLGTPVPVAAPERLVVGGPYRYVRNPMYVAILAAIVGQALLLGQLRLLLFAAVFWPIVAAFVRWYEEPALCPSIRRGLRGLPARSARLVAPPAPLEPQRPRTRLTRLSTTSGKGRPDYR